MFFRENETLYYTTFEYNAALILEELAQIITTNGGKVKPMTPGYIVNRSFYDAEREETESAERIRHYSEIKKPDAEKAAELEKRAAEREAAAESYRRQADESKRPTAHLTYINFTLDGFYYYMQLDEWKTKLVYCKTPINNGRRSKDVYLSDLNTSWIIDDFYKLIPAPEIETERREAAKSIFEALKAAGASEKYREGKKTRVSNVYNSGYHYETIYRPERTEAIDF